LKFNLATGGRWDWTYRTANALFGRATSAGILGGVYVINPEFHLHRSDGSQPMLILAKDLENVKSKKRKL